MLLYLYTSKNSVFSYLSRNLIAPASVVPDRLGIHTVGLLNEDFLFVTHKKLNVDNRNYGIADPDIANPVTLAIEIDSRQENNSCILVSEDSGSIKTEIATWKAYDIGKHIGAYLLGEIPLSLVKTIYFENKKQQEEFYRPSPDYWYPENKYSILPVSEFSEEIDITLLQKIDLKSFDIDLEKNYKDIICREKARAALLCLTDATKKWNYGEVLLNIDPVLQTIVGSDIVTDIVIQKQISDCNSLPCTPYNEELNLLPFHKKLEKQSLNQEIYNTIFECFCNTPMEKDSALSYYDNVLKEIIKIVKVKADTMIYKRISDFAEESHNILKDLVYSS